MTGSNTRSPRSRAESTLHAGVTVLGWRFVANTLRVKVLLAFLVVALVPLAIMAHLNQRTSEQALTNSGNQALFAAASQTAVRLDAFITGDLAVIGTEAQLPMLAEYLHQLADKRETGEVKARTLAILRSFARKDAVFIASVGLLDLQGRNVIATASQDIGGDESGRDYFRAALETGLAHVSPVEFSPDDGKASLCFSSVVVNSDTGKPVGVLRARYSAAALQQVVVQGTGMVGPQSHPILLDENGLVLADGLSSPGSPSNLLFKSAMPLGPARAAELVAARRMPSQPYDNLFAQLSGLTEYLERVDGSKPYSIVQRSAAGVEPYAAAVVRMETLPWLVAFLQPQETLLAPVRAQQRSTLTLAVMIVLLVAAAAMAAARFLTNPIVHLTVVAREVAEGNYDAKANVESNDEIGILAGAFNSMTERLQASIVSLEQRVAELDRTSLALRESEERYRLVFENSPVSIWEEDFSGVKALLDDLKKAGVSDIESYFTRRPEAVQQCADRAEIVRVNRAALALHEAANREELLAGLVNTHTPEYFDTFRQELACLWNGGTEMTGDAVVKTLAGKLRNVTVYFSVCPGYEGTLSKVIVSLVDITERRLAEQERQANLRFFESMDKVNGALHGVRELDSMMNEVLDVVLSIFDCDRAFLMYPCDPEAATWRIPVERHKPEYPGALSLGLEMPMDEDVARTIRELLATDRPVKFGPETEHPLPEEVSQRFGFRSFMSIAIYPKEGLPWQFGIHQCSSARTWTQEEERILIETGRRLADGISSLLSFRELRESEARYRLIVDTATEGIWVLGADTKTTFVNARMAGMLGYSCEEMDGRPLTDFMHEEDVPDHLTRMENRRRGLSESYERRFRHKCGQLVWTNVSATPIVDAELHYGGSFGMFTDITEHKRAEREILHAKEDLELKVRERTTDLESKNTEIRANQSALMNIVEDLNEKSAELAAANAKLLELDRLKAMFIAAMSHELRTPLNSIIGFSSIMLNEWTGPLTTEQKENLSSVLRSGKHLLSLINDVIDVSKIEAGKIESIAEDFDVADLVREAVETLRKDIEQKRLELKVLAPRQVLHADRRRILQCLLNLLSNAVKFTDAGVIEVCSDPSDDGAFFEFSVRDTGVGIKEEDIGKLFSPFMRLVSPQRAVIPGTGLGLYLTRKLARDILRGDIAVSSTYGTGSRFTLRIPLAGPGAEEYSNQDRPELG